MLFQDILRAAAEGDETTLKQLFRMYQPLITKMSKMGDSFDDDLHQEQLLCFWRCVKKFIGIFLITVTKQNNT